MSREGMELRAAVDLGTNSALLLVARVDGDGTLLVVEDHCMTPRLGDGLWRTGTLDEAAVERTLEVLHHFADRLQRQGVAQGRQRVVATAVLRKARDAREFVARVKESCGLDLEILSELHDFEFDLDGNFIPFEGCDGAGSRQGARAGMK